MVMGIVIFLVVVGFISCIALQKKISSKPKDESVQMRESVRIDAAEALRLA